MLTQTLEPLAAPADGTQFPAGGSAEATAELQILSSADAPEAVSMLFPSGIVTSTINFLGAPLASVERLRFQSAADTALTSTFSLGFLAGNVTLANQIGAGLAADAELVGGDGYDTVQLVGSTSLVGPILTAPSFTYDANWQGAARAYQPGDRVQVILLGSDAVTLNGSAHAGVQVLLTGSGNDTVNGSGDMDFIAGGGGVDMLNGNGGDDALWAGNSHPNGNPGAETNNTYAGSVFDGGDGTDFLSTGGNVNFQGTLVSIEGIHLAAAYVSTAANTVSQKPAALTLSGATLADLPDDLILDGEGNIIVNLADGDDFDGLGYQFDPGSNVRFTVNGSAGDDTIVGTANNDAINGGAGRDVIALGGGASDVDGGSGVDIAVFAGNRGDYIVVTGSEGRLEIGDSNLINVELYQFDDGAFYWNGSALISAANSGVVADGYVAGATVYIDADGNGQLGDDEPFTITDANGDFVLNSHVQGALRAFGGANVDTGRPNSVQFAAPEGATVINPLTTLVEALVQGGTEVGTASAQILAAFGLEASLNLMTLDLISAAETDPNALAAQKTAAAVAEVLDAVTDAGGNSDSAAQALATIAQQTESGEPVDLTGGTVLQAVIAAGASNLSETQIDQLVEDTQMVTTAIEAAADVQGVTEAQSNFDPVATDDVSSALANQPITYLAADLLGNDNDQDGDTLAIAFVSNASNGTVKVNQDGSITFTPSGEFVGDSGFDYMLSDGKGGNDLGHVTINLAATNTIVDQSSDEDEYWSFVIPVSAFGDAGNLVFSALLDGGAPLPSWLRFDAATRTLTGTPPENFSGSLEIKVIVSNGSNDVSATFTLTIDAVNDAPTGSTSRSVSTNENVPTALVPIGASDVDGDALTYSIKSGSAPSKGSVTFVEGGFQYTPNQNAIGSDSFVILIEDGKGGSMEQAVRISITPAYSPPLNSTPTAFNDIVAAVEGKSATYRFADLLANDIDADGDPLAITQVFNAQGGSVSVSGAQIVFTPQAGFFGNAGFDYTLSDDRGGIDTAHVTVKVAPLTDSGENPINTAPLLSRISPLGTIAGKGIVLKAAASDADGDALIFAASTPAHGTVATGADGRIVYMPGAAFTGADSFLVSVSDGKGGTASQVVQVNVLALANQPDWRLLTDAGFAGDIGGMGQVFGMDGFDDLAVLDLPGSMVFDGSFNLGGDVIRLDGSAGDWRVVASSSIAVFSDGDTFLQVPIGVHGMAMVFDDGARTLRYDEVADKVMLGSQLITQLMEVITAAPSSGALPENVDPDAGALLLMETGGAVTAGGNLTVFGTSGAETIHILHGNAVLDASFNLGGDRIVLQDAADAFTAQLNGSRVVLDSGHMDVTIPVGIEGVTIAFADEDRILRYDPELDAVFMDLTQISPSIVLLTDFA